MKKICSKCLIEYEPDEAIKRRNWCRECLRAYHKDYQRRQRLNPEMLAKERVASRKHYRNKYQPGSDYRAKKLARRKLLYAIAKGKIQRPKNCRACGIKCTPQAHHEDYAKPLDVAWLCESCHSMHHRQM